MEEKNITYGSTTTNEESQDDVNSVSVNQRRFQRENFYKCCGSNLDKRLVEFISQFTVCFVIIGFCISQLIKSPDCDEANLYSSLLTMILGVLLPSPKTK